MFEGIQYLAIEGVIGVGKTSLLEILSRMHATGKMLETHEDNPFLELFYKDREKYAFQTQLWFLLSRYRQVTEQLRQKDLFHKAILSDFLFAKDSIFAHMNLNENELILYSRIAGALEKDVIKPDFVIYLQASTDVLMGRIASRGRPLEKNISRAYIDNLNQAYNHFFFHYQDSPVLIVDTNHINFVENLEELDEIVHQIGKHYQKGGTTYYHPLGRKGLQLLAQRDGGKIA